MKHKLEGIGEAGAILMMSTLATSFPLATTGLQGKILFILLKIFHMALASAGLIVVNIGVAKVETLIEHKDFDGSFDKAFEIINKKKGQFTDEEAKKIDDAVIDAYRKFATFIVRDRRNT